jgi:hypothetical protein
MEMAKRHRLVGLPNGAIDPDKHEILFDLAVSRGAPILFVARYGPLAQLTAGLGRMLFQLRQILDDARAVETIPAEEVAVTQIQRDRWQDRVLMQLTTPQGVPYTFAFPSQIANSIADQLKAESAKPHRVGNA